MIRCTVFQLVDFVGLKYGTFDFVQRCTAFFQQFIDWNFISKLVKMAT